MASEVKVDKLSQKGSSGIVITDDIKLSSGKAIKNASGTALLGEDGALGSGVTGAGAWQLLETITIGTESTVKVGQPAGSTYLTSTYKIYKIYGINLTVSADTNISARVYRDNVLFDGTAGYNYRYTKRVTTYGEADSVTGSDNNQFPYAAGGPYDVGSGADEQSSFICTFFAPTVTAFKEPFNFESWFIDGSGADSHTHVFGTVANASSDPITAVQFFTTESGSTFTGGTIKLYGIS